MLRSCLPFTATMKAVCSLLYDITQPRIYLPDITALVRKTVLFLLQYKAGSWLTIFNCDEFNFAPVCLHYCHKLWSPEVAWNRIKNRRTSKLSTQPYLYDFSQTWQFLNHILPHFNIIFSCIRKMSSVHGKIKFRTSGIISFSCVFRQCNAWDDKN